MVTDVWSVCIVRNSIWLRYSWSYDSPANNKVLSWMNGHLSHSKQMETYATNKQLFPNYSRLFNSCIHRAYTWLKCWMKWNKWMKTQSTSDRFMCWNDIRIIFHTFPFNQYLLIDIKANKPLHPKCEWQSLSSKLNEIGCL